MKMKFVPIDHMCKMNYAVFYPEEYRDLPLLVYLHGAGERGTNFDHVYRHAIPKLIHEGKDIPAVILIPQCPAEYVWDNIVCDVKALIDTVTTEFSIKKDRICITGSSMGGYGTWSMGLTYSNFFSGIAPIAGGGMVWRAGTNLKTTPIYAVHGAKDDLVLPIHSKLMCDKVITEGGNAKLVILNDYGHNDAINYAYAHTDVIDWLLKQRRTDFSPVPEFCSELF